jgi:hypothetical protein
VLLAKYGDQAGFIAVQAWAKEGQHRRLQEQGSAKLLATLAMDTAPVSIALGP